MHEQISCVKAAQVGTPWPSFAFPLQQLIWIQNSLLLACRMAPNSLIAVALQLQQWLVSTLSFKYRVSALFMRACIPCNLPTS